MGVGHQGCNHSIYWGGGIMSKSEYVTPNIYYNYAHGWVIRGIYLFI